MIFLGVKKNDLESISSKTCVSIFEEAIRKKESFKSSKGHVYYSKFGSMEVVCIITGLGKLSIKEFLKSINIGDDLEEKIRDFNSTDYDIIVCRNRIESVHKTMVKNVSKIQDNMVQLEEIESKTEDLSDNALLFSQSARRIKKKFLKKALVGSCLLICTCIFILIFLTVVILIITGVIESKS